MGLLNVYVSPFLINIFTRALFLMYHFIVKILLKIIIRCTHEQIKSLGIIFDFVNVICILFFLCTFLTCALIGWDQDSDSLIDKQVLQILQCYYLHSFLPFILQIFFTRITILKLPRVVASFSTLTAFLFNLVMWWKLIFVMAIWIYTTKSQNFLNLFSTFNK